MLLSQYCIYNQTRTPLLIQMEVTNNFYSVCMQKNGQMVSEFGGHTHRSWSQYTVIELNSFHLIRKQNSSHYKLLTWYHRNDYDHHSCLQYAKVMPSLCCACRLSHDLDQRWTGAFCKMTSAEYAEACSRPSLPPLALGPISRGEQSSTEAGLLG